TRPINASTWHLTVALLALSSDPLSTTVTGRSPRSTATVANDMSDRPSRRDGRTPPPQKHTHPAPNSSRPRGPPGRRRPALRAPMWGALLVRGAADDMILDPQTGRTAGRCGSRGGWVAAPKGEKRPWTLPF